MDFEIITTVLRELGFLILVFTTFILTTCKFGRQSTINIILGLYFALLLTKTATFLPAESAIGYIAVFILLTISATAVIRKLMPLPFKEKFFESFGKKLFLAAGATVLVMIFSFHVVPVSTIITIGSPISYMFASEQYFFWWLVAPFVLLYFHK